jgi:ABC-type molybdate transport system substrate-binding protein
MLRRAFLTALIVTTFSLPAQAQTRDIILFADASLKPAIDEANILFLSDNAMNVVVTYGATPELARQLENGAMADVFISAGPTSMSALTERKLVEPDTRADLVRKAPTVYPVAILTNSTNVLASIYVQYLTSGKAAPFFEKQGFVFLP